MEKSQPKQQNSLFGKLLEEMTFGRWNCLSWHGWHKVTVITVINPVNCWPVWESVRHRFWPLRSNEEPNYDQSQNEAIISIIWEWISLSLSAPLMQDLSRAQGALFQWLYSHSAVFIISCERQKNIEDQQFCSRILKMSERNTTKIFFYKHTKKAFFMRFFFLPKNDNFLLLLFLTSRKCMDLVLILQ